MNKLKGAFSAFMSFVLAVGLCPALALAQPAEGADEGAAELAGASAWEDTADAQQQGDEFASGGSPSLAADYPASESDDPENAGDDPNGVRADSESPDPDELVTVIVELQPGLTHGGFFGLFAQSGSDHQGYRNRIAELMGNRARQSAAQGGAALGAQSLDYNVDGCDYYNVIDGFTVQVPRSAIDDIRALDGVAAAFESEAHAAPADLGVQESAPLNESSLGMTGADSVSYTGKGQVIAIVDTGLKTDHEAFAGDLDDASVVLTEDKVGEIKANLGEGKSGKYVSEKIPFAYDYAMDDDDVADGSGHGTHVAGIAAANAGDVRGTAPDAQIVAMKVSSDNGTIYDDALLAALDDCAKFDLAAVNISIGADGGFSGDAQDTMANAVNALEASGTVVNVAAGNSYSSAQSNLSGKNLPYATDPDSGTLSSPASAAQATAVASANNVIGMPYSTLANGTQIVWQGAQLQSDGSAWPTLDALPDGEYELFYDDSDTWGEGKFYAHYGSAMGVATGGGDKIVIVERGGQTPRGSTASFGDKVRYCEGALALIVYDNEEADMPMKMLLDSWAEYVSSRYPAVSVTNAAGQMLRKAADDGVKLVVKSGQITSPEGAPEINDFSSWGATPDMSLKPDITAPGGNIYSSTNDGGYGYLSGTSMATPQMTGISAQVRQYVDSDAKFAGLTNVQRNDVVTQLLMSTAKPLADTAVEGSYYSPRQQGSGIANVPAATKTNVYLTVDGAVDAAHPKAELGESENGTWEFTVTLHNLGDSPASYTPSAAALSDQIVDGLFQQHSANYTGKGIDVTFGGSAYQGGKVTVPANGTASYTVTITCGDAFKQAVTDAENGTFVDGFAFLKAEEGGVDLSVPFMGFYGDWSTAPIFDGKLTASDAHLYGSYLETDGFDGPLGFNPLDSDSVYDFNNGSNMSKRGTGNWRDYYYPERLVVSNSADPKAPKSVTTNTYLLRGASEFQWGFSKKDAKEGIQAYYRAYLKKSKPSGNSAHPISTAEAIANGYASFSFKGLDEGWYQVEEDAIVAGDENAEPQELVYDIYYDKTAPAISDIVNTEGDDAKVSFTVTDASWLAGVTVQTNPVYVTSTSESIKNYLDTDLNAQDTVDADGNRVYEVSISIADLKTAWIADGYRNEDEMPNTLSLIAWDWGMNPSEPITAVLKPVPATGIAVAPESLSLAPGQHGLVEATLAPADTTDVQVDWSSSDETVAKVDANGQVTAVAAGTATITGAVHGREGVVATASVKVSDITAKTGVVLSDSVVRVRCDQKEKPATSVDVSAMLADSLGDAAVNWTVSDDDVFSIEIDPDDPNKVTISGGYQVGVGTLSATVVDNGKIRSATVEVRNWPDDYEDFVIDENGTLTAYNGAQLSVEIPNDVKVVGKGVFADKRATEVRIPASVELIEKEAFLNTTAGTVAFEDTEEHPSKLVEVGERAFANDAAGQNSWSSFRFPGSVTTLGEGVMEGKSCSQIYVPESVTAIPDRAFTGTHDVIYIGDDVTWIGDNAFSGANPQAMMFAMLYVIGHEDEQNESGDSLLPGKLTHIGANAFNGTNVFTELNVPAGVTFIGEGAFASASQSIHNNGGPALKVTLNEGLEHIGDGAFSSTRIDGELVIPDSVVELGDNAFGSVGTLKKVTIGKNVEAKRLGKVFTYSDSITEFVVPEDCANYTADAQGIVYSKDMSTLVAFPMGKEAPDYVIPEGVKTIGECAFDAYDGSFLDFCKNYPNSITFPDSLEVIETHALNTYLPVVNLGPNVKEVAIDAFRDVYGNDDLNPASPAHLVVRGGQDYTVGYTDNVDYFHTSYFGPGVKSIDFDGSGFRTSDIMVVNSDTLESFAFTTNWWPGWSSDPVEIYAKKESEAYKTIKQAILEKVDFTQGAYYDGWCADVEDNESQYDGKRKPILRYYEELKASIDADNDIEPGSTVNLTVVPEGGVGSVQVRWFSCVPEGALGAQSTTAWLEGKTPLWDEGEGDGWTSDLSYEWKVPEDGSTVVAEVRDASYYSVQASMADTPAFATQPEAAKVLQDAQLVLTAEAVVGDGGAVTYQWFKSSSADMADAALIPGATSATYAVPTDELGSTYYAVIARNTIDSGLYAESRSDVVAVEVVDVDKDALDKAIEQAGAIEQGKKSDEAFAALREAIADAEDVSGDAGATQLEVDGAVEALSKAVKAFNESADVAKPSDNPSDPDAGKPSEPAAPSDPDAGKPSEPATPSNPTAPSAPGAQPETPDPAPVQPSSPEGDSTPQEKPAAPSQASGGSADAAAEGDGSMMRLYNPYSGEHFYTADVSERDNLVPLGWEYEGVGWIAPEWSNTPVFRMYNPYAGEHHYCMTESEHDALTDAGWEYEGIGWYSDDEQRTPLYREYNPYMFSCNHNYTTNKEEHDYLVSLGWIDEGFAWYGM